VSNLLREWKVNIVCFYETKLEVMSCSVMHSLWGCYQVDWYCLDSKGVQVVFRLCGIEGGGEDRRVWGNSLWLSLLETLKIIPLGLLRVFMTIILIEIEGFCGMVG
jgi:hypothetical protein